METTPSTTVADAILAVAQHIVSHRLTFWSIDSTVEAPWIRVLVYSGDTPAWLDSIPTHTVTLREPASTGTKSIRVERACAIADGTQFNLATYEYAAVTV